MRSSQEAGRRSVEAHKSLARKDSAIPADPGKSVTPASSPVPSTPANSPVPAVSPKSPRDSFVDISLPPPSAPCVASPRF